jgi:Metallopeptidase family M24
MIYLFIIYYLLFILLFVIYATVSVKPGVMYREIGEVISRVVHKKGFSVVKSYCGHGVGRMFHCAPNVPHYASICFIILQVPLPRFFVPISSPLIQNSPAHCFISPILHILVSSCLVSAYLVSATSLLAFFLLY